MKEEKRNKKEEAEKEKTVRYKEEKKQFRSFAEALSSSNDGTPPSCIQWYIQNIEYYLYYSKDRFMDTLYSV